MRRETPSGDPDRPTDSGQSRGQTSELCDIPTGRMMKNRRTRGRVLPARRRGLGTDGRADGCGHREWKKVLELDPRNGQAYTYLGITVWQATPPAKKYCSKAGDRSRRPAEIAWGLNSVIASSSTRRSEFRCEALLLRQEILPSCPRCRGQRALAGWRAGTDAPGDVGGWQFDSRPAFTGHSMPRA